MPNVSNTDNMRMDSLNTQLMDIMRHSTQYDPDQSKGGYCRSPLGGYVLRLTLLVA